MVEINKSFLIIWTTFQLFQTCGLRLFGSLGKRNEHMNALCPSVRGQREDCSNIKLSGQIERRFCSTDTPAHSLHLIAFSLKRLWIIKTLSRSLRVNSFQERCFFLHRCLWKRGRPVEWRNMIILSLKVLCFVAVALVSCRRFKFHLLNWNLFTVWQLSWPYCRSSRNLSNRQNQVWWKLHACAYIVCRGSCGSYCPPLDRQTSSLPCFLNWLNLSIRDTCCC